MKNMKLGWNLGNTLDAPAGETSWGNHVTTREMIKKVHSLGFETLRLPVSWHRHIDENFKISPEWLGRVREIIDYAYEDGMYVILNIHHDNHLFQPTAEGFESGKAYITAIWSQLCAEFGDYGERLIFEAMNEPRILHNKYEWNLDLSEQICLDAIEYINRYNQAFVDTVRAAGGFNKERFLMTPSYAAAPHHTYIPEYRLAEDPSGKLIVSVHSYEPINLCLLPDPDATVFDEKGERHLDFTFKKLRELFIDNGIPIIIGEMGIVDKKNPDSRRRWSEYFVKKARENGMISVWWDNGGHEFKLLDRRNLTVFEESKCVLEGLLKGCE